MTISKKRFSFGWVLGVLLGITCGGAIVYAGAISDTYTTGDPLTAAKMTAVKTAVNDNDARITSNGARITSLETGTGACTINAGDDVAGMVRVGPICVDKFRARATIGLCTGDGATDCAGVIAVSTATGLPAENFSWAQAVRACTNAGKRLLTPGEYMAAFFSGSLLETASDTYDFVDALLTIRSTAVGTDPSGPGVTVAAQGSYMGPASGTAPAGLVQMISNVAYNLVNPDGGGTFLFFRCGR